jgi:hypothetical protein
VTGLSGSPDAWLLDPSTNHGIMIRAVSDYYGEPYLYSSDSPLSARRPRLVLESSSVPVAGRSWGHIKALFRQGG